MELASASTQSSTTTAPPLVFGIYPGGGVGINPGSGEIAGVPDDPEQIKAALTQLQPTGRPFVVRGYLHYIGKQTIENVTPADMQQYVADGRQLELVICYRTPDGDLDDWAETVRTIVRQYGPALSILQITEEPNNLDAATGGDGSFPNVQQAIVTGILAAKDEMRRQGYNFQVGFNATLSFNNDFWVQLGQIMSSTFIEQLDYVGFDFFPDVFRPLPPGPDGMPISLEAAVVGVLTGYRNVNLPAANIPAKVPIHICENGWPTSQERSYERQAEVLEQIVRVVYAHRAELNITHYKYFDLRDADSTDGGLQFGLLRDDYSPKPAFERYKQLIAELG